MRLRLPAGYVTMAVLSLSAAGCGGGASTATTPITPTPTGPTTVELTGTTRQTSVNGCSGDSHELTMAAGAVSVTLVETTDPAAAMSVQICPGQVDTGVCSIKQQRIARGQTLTGERVGSATQTVKLLPHACVFGSTFDPTPLTYKVSVTYVR